MIAALKAEWPAAKPPAELTLSVGPFASGASVVADSATVQKAVASQRKLLGIDMEVYGLFAATAEASEPRPKPFAMKTVVDFGDSAKHDEYQTYGSFVSAGLLKCFVEDHLAE